MNTYEISAGGKIYKVEIDSAVSAASTLPGAGPIAELAYRVRVDGRDIAVNCIPVSKSSLSLIVNGESFDVSCKRAGEALEVALRGAIYECIVSDPRSLRTRKRAGLADSGEQKLTASMPGKVVRIIAAVGDQIKAGQGILVIEAMKMQNEVRSPKNGQLKKLLVGQGANVVAGEVLATIE
jgi:biotin carboxyl carrier protein